MMMMISMMMVLIMMMIMMMKSMVIMMMTMRHDGFSGKKRPSIEVWHLSPADTSSSHCLMTMIIMMMTVMMTMTHVPRLVNFFFAFDILVKTKNSNWCTQRESVDWGMCQPKKFVSQPNERESMSFWWQFLPWHFQLWGVKGEFYGWPLPPLSWHQIMNLAFSIAKKSNHINAEERNISSDLL